MEDTMQILVDTLTLNGLSWEEILMATSGLTKPQSQLDMAEWAIKNPMATRQERAREKVRLIMKYELD